MKIKRLNEEIKHDSIENFILSVKEEGVEAYVWENRRFGWNFPDEELNSMLNEYLNLMNQIYKKIESLDPDKEYWA